VEKYKGYSAMVGIDEDRMILHGRVAGVMKDVITFEGATVPEFVQDLSRFGGRLFGNVPGARRETRVYTMTTSLRCVMFFIFGAWLYCFPTG